MLDSIAAAAVTSRLKRITDGHLIVRDGAQTIAMGDASARAVTVTVHDRRFYSALAFGGHLGAAESYFEGYWSVDDLTALTQLFVRNRNALEQLDSGWAWLARPASALYHALRRNTRSGSRSNIAAHYDLGNEFFSLFLDDTLTYSCGVFESPASTLRDASVAKYDRLCRKLDLGPDDHVLEIGTGWGGFAMHAAATYGCRVTTTTISREQYAMARTRIEQAGLADRVTVLNQDYRDLTGRYNKLVSIEMIEAVGHQYFETFFRRCAALLTPDGRMAIQAITIQEQLYEAARDNVDFIKRYIFPGSCIPSVGALRGAAGVTDLQIVHSEEIGLHYAETLKRWRHGFAANWPRISALGFPDSFARLWEFYFCYCEGGFLEGAINDMQLVFSKPADVASGTALMFPPLGAPAR